jgi:predicted PurR-regulated permease PerM
MQSFNDYVPLSIKKQKEILKKIQKAIKVLFKGYFLTGIVQTMIAFVGYIIFGVDNLLVVTFLTLISSLIPYIGTPIVWVPIGFYMFVTGSQIGGIGIIIYGTLIISMVDNFLRPVLMSDKDTLHPALVFIGFIGGMGIFGISGIILGPLILSVTSIFFKFLKEHYVDNV